jgi:predicted NBD/HSP70 family sugar kinase
MSSAEIARRSGLSAQTVSNIIRSLEADGLLKRGETVKGKIGKPSVPMALNPNGILSLGLNIGRRSAELVLIDFNGARIDARTTSYAYPDIKGVFSFLEDGIRVLYNNHPEARHLVTGLGVARPYELWNWLEFAKAPAAAMQEWQDPCLARRLTDVTGLEVFLENDATSACVAEHLLGRGNEFHDFAYIFVGAFVGGGLVLNSKVFTGVTGNAGALGSLLVPDRSGGMTQLLNVASLHVLERALSEAGIDPQCLRRNPDDWSRFEQQVAIWIETTGAYLAIAAASIASVVEVEAILIEGAMPEQVRHRLTESVRGHLSDLDLTGIVKPRIEEASVGKGARSIGAALLPIHSRYFLA